MKVIKFKDLGSRKIPASWQEVNVHSYLKFTYEWDGKDPIRLLAILLNESDETVFNLGEDPAKVEKVLSYLLKDLPDWEQLKKRVPTTIEIKGKELKVKPVSRGSLGQKVYLEQLAGNIKGELDKIPQLIPAVCAIYLSPQYFGKDNFSVEESEELTEIILQEPILKIFPMAYFFLGRSRNSILAGINAWRPQSLNKILRKKLLERAADLLSLKK